MSDNKKNKTEKDFETKSKVKPISKSQFEKVMNKNYSPTEVVEWNGIDITIKKTLSLREVINFVKDVVDLCFSKKDEIYLPEVQQFAIKANVLTYYANFKLPKRARSQYQLVYCTDAFETVSKHINPAQFVEMCNAIDKKLRHESSVRIYNMEKQVDKLYEYFDALETQIGDVFKDITGEQVKDMMNAISDKKFDNKALMDAYFEHKEEQAEDEAQDTQESDTAEE